MIRKLAVYLFVVLAVTAGCDSQKGAQVDKEPIPLYKPGSRSDGTEVALATGEQDQFHPDSVIESIRKTSLTRLGTMKNMPPERTPDTEAAQEAMNLHGYSYMRIGFTKNDVIELPAYPFDFEQDVQVLRRLYNHHNLDSVISNDMDEVEQLVALMKYTYSFMDGGQDASGELWWQNGPSAETITEFREKRGIGGTSEQYAALFCQLALSCGYTSRMVGMHTIDDSGEILSHTVCEVYLQDASKWVCFDPYSRATYYTRNGVPLSALEIRNMMLDSLYRVIQPIIGIGDISKIVDVREELLPRYRYLYMWRMNNILSSSRGGNFTWQALWATHLVWEDEKAPISEGAFDRLACFTNMNDPDHALEGVRFVTHDTIDFYWPIYNFQVNIERPRENRIIYHLDTMTPNFDHYKLTIQENGQIHTVTGDTFVQNSFIQVMIIEVVDQFGKIRNGNMISYE